MPTTPIATFDDLAFDHLHAPMLTGDSSNENRPRTVIGALHSPVDPTAVADPSMVIWSRELAADLGLSPAAMRSDRAAQVLSGNAVPAGAKPHAANYGGHQFGHWADQLGDGRAINLGEMLDTQGARQMLQLKGAGPTPYSRTADGRAVMRSSVREFLCSEAMAHLGVPTTRALSLVATGDEVVRDIMYSGHPAPEPGAIVCRVAPSFIRFGSFQLPAVRGEYELMIELARFTLLVDYPDIASEHSNATTDDDVISAIPALFSALCTRSADLVVDWMRVGFVHGVLNTDNMSIGGLTIDYGPYGWLEGFDPNWTPNTTDAEGRRYRYGAQPQIVLWNLLQLAQALVLLTDDAAPFEAALDDYSQRYKQRYIEMTVQRLGWREVVDGDDELISQLHSALQSSEIDYVIFHRLLGGAVEMNASQTFAHLAPAWYDAKAMAGDTGESMREWIARWVTRRDACAVGAKERSAQMHALNPKYVPRNYLTHQAAQAAEQGDYAMVHDLYEAFKNPYDEQPEFERFAQRRPEWARHQVGSSMLSCSS